MPDTWMIVWLFWLGLFLVFELMAVILRKRTLSQQTWGWFSLAERKRYWQARRAIFAIFWILLGVHFVFQAPALYTVILPGIPFAAVIMLSSFVWKDASPQKEQVMSESVKLAAPYDWKKTLWKGLRPAFIAGGAAFLAALAQSVDVQWLVALGVPSFLAVFIAEAVRNYVKQHGV